MRRETAKLGSLSTKGRSSAATGLTLAARPPLMGETDLTPETRKLLAFTDNRQDASLQAGHFNDFLQVLLLRGALLAALRDQPDGVLTDDVRTRGVLAPLRLPPADYAASPEAKGAAKAEGARRALRDV